MPSYRLLRVATMYVVMFEIQPDRPSYGSLLLQVCQDIVNEGGGDRRHVHSQEPERMGSGFLLCAFEGFRFGAQSQAIGIIPGRNWDIVHGWVKACSEHYDTQPCCQARFEYRLQL